MDLILNQGKAQMNEEIFKLIYKWGICDAMLSIPEESMPEIYSDERLEIMADNAWKQIIQNDYCENLLLFNKENNDYRAISLPCPKKVIEIFNTEIKNTSIPRVHRLTTERRTKINNISKEYFKTLEEWTEYFKRVAKSSFMLGNNHSSWIVNFDFILQVDKTTKILKED